MKNAMLLVVGGLAVALLITLVAGCSSSGGCRPCRKESPGREPAPLGYNSTAVPQTLPTTAALPYGGQKKCPVTGEDLGSMGKPLAVTLKGETVYVCCRGCVAKAQADPDKTLAAVAADKAGR